MKIYEQDPIAEDAEDERRIKKAIKQAEVEKGNSAKNGDFVKRPLRKFNHRKSNYTSYSRQNSFNKRRCYNCDSIYHIARDCTRSRDDKNKNRNNYFNKVLDK